MTVNRHNLVDNITAVAALPLLVAGYLLARYATGVRQLVGIAFLVLLGGLFVYTRNARIRHAEAGSPADKLAIAADYVLGRGVSKDEGEGFKWVERAAKQGDSAAQFGLGLHYDEGLGVERDYQEAMKWYRMSADNGYPPAFLHVGKLFELGQGVGWPNLRRIHWLAATRRSRQEAGKNEKADPRSEDPRSAEKWAWLDEYRTSMALGREKANHGQVDECIISPSPVDRRPGSRKRSARGPRR